MPIGDYSSESIGLFQGNPTARTIPSPVGPPCSPACIWSYLDRTEARRLQRVFSHTHQGDTREFGIDFAQMTSGEAHVEALLADFAAAHHEVEPPKWSLATAPRDAHGKVMKRQPLI